jgi:hypothetical protein
LCTIRHRCTDSRAPRDARRARQRLARPGPQYTRFFVLQDQPFYNLTWLIGNTVFRGTQPGLVGFTQLITTFPTANVNRIFVHRPAPCMPRSADDPLRSIRAEPGHRIMREARFHPCLGVPAFTGSVYVAAGDVGSFVAYAEGYLDGVFVAAGDGSGDGKADIVTGTGTGGGPHVKVFDGPTPAELESFFAYPAGILGSLRVAAGSRP